MSKTSLLLFLFMFLASCGKSNNSNSPSAVASSEEISSVIIPTDAYTFEVNARFFNFSRIQENKIERAIELIKKVITSDEFKSKVINKTYNGKKQFVDNNGLSNSKIYQRILDGAEKLGNSAKNNAMDVDLELYLDSGSIALGYTYPTTKKIWMNKKYFNDFQPHQVAGNLFHEWLHKLGFKHSMKADPNRPHSVPYSVGYLMRDMAKKIDQ